MSEERIPDQNGMIECKRCDGTGIFKDPGDAHCVECEIGCACEYCKGLGKVLWVDDIMDRKTGEKRQ